MDLRVFQEILEKTLSENQLEIQQAEASLLQFKELEYEFFLQLLLNSIINPINNRIPPISIVHLYREARNGQLIINQEYAINFLKIFAENITNLLLNTNIEDQFKNTLSLILAILHTFLYKESQNATIPQYILTAYIHVPQIRKYLMNCIYEIVIADFEFGGFSFENLIQILESELEDQDLLAPRIHLFFSLAKNKPDLQELHSFFEKFILLQLTNHNFCQITLKSIANFADINSYFFAPHIQLLFKSLIFLSLDRQINNDIRDLAILCIMSIVKNAPKMCKSMDNFYLNIIAPFVLIVSEFTNENSWEYNPNDMRPCIQAIDAISIIDESLKDPYGFATILQVYQPVLNPNAESSAVSPILSNLQYGKDSWQSKYAVISSLTSLVNPFSDFSPIIEALKFMTPFLDLNTLPQLRIATYKFLKAACKHVTPHYLMDIMNIIDIIFKTTFEDQVPIAKQTAFKVLSFIFTIPCIYTAKEIIYNRFFLPYFKLLIDILPSQQPEISKYIVQCIGNMNKIIKNKDMNIIQLTSQTLFALIQASNDLSFMIKIIHAFTTSLAIIPFTQFPPEIIQISLFFLQTSLQIYGDDRIDEDDVKELTQAIVILLTKLNKKATPLIEGSIPRILAIAGKEIGVEQTETLESVYGLISLYIQVPSSDSSLKKYVSRNDVIEVKQALRFINAIINSDEENPKYFDVIIKISRYWIYSNIFIEDLSLFSWYNLYSILSLNRKKNDLIELMLKCYIDTNYTQGSPKYQNRIIIIISEVLYFAKENRYLNQELFIILLKRIPDLIEHVVNTKTSLSNAMHTYNNYDSQDKTLNHINDLLININKLVSICCQLSPQLTFQYVFNQLMPKVNELMQNFEFLCFSAQFFSIFFIYVNPDIEQIIKYTGFIFSTILNIAADFSKSDTTEFLFGTLGNLFYHVNLHNRPDFCNQIVLFFEQFFEKVIDTDIYEFDQISDYANIAFTKFLMVNLSYTSNPVDAVFDWDNFKPLWDATQDSEYYYTFMIYLIEKTQYLQELDIYWVEEYIPAILKDLSIEKIGESNLKKIGNLLKLELNNKIGQDCVQKILQDSQDLQSNYNQLIEFSNKQ